MCGSIDSAAPVRVYCTPDESAIALAQIGASCPAWFAEYGESVRANGFFVFPVPAGQKKTHWKGWPKLTSNTPAPEKVVSWSIRYPHYSVAIGCSNLLVVDIDDLDPAKGDWLEKTALGILGSTPLVRFGQRPKRALVYRVDSNLRMRSNRVGKVDLLTGPSYLLAYGTHPSTKLPYTWLDQSPATLAHSELPVVSPASFQLLVSEFRNFYGPFHRSTPLRCFEEEEAARPRPTLPAKKVSSRPQADARWTLDHLGRVIDGRDAFLASCVYAAYCSGLDSVVDIAGAAFARFLDQADVSKPKRNGNKPWSLADVKKKARALLASGKKRPFSRSSHATGFWTFGTKQAFRHQIDAVGASRTLSPAQVAVSHAMLSYVGSGGTCFAAVGTLAHDTALKLDTVKKARHALREKGFWLSASNLGGRTRTAHYSPNPAVLTDTFRSPAKREAFSPAASMWSRDTETVDGFATQNSQGGEGEPQEEPSSGESNHSPPTYYPAVDPSFQISSQASLTCHEKRSSDATINVAEVPHHE